MSIYHVYIPCLYTMSIYHVYIPCLYTMSIYHVYIPCLYTMSIYHVYISWSESGRRPAYVCVISCARTHTYVRHRHMRVIYTCIYMCLIHICAYVCIHVPHIHMRVIYTFISCAHVVCARTSVHHVCDMSEIVCACTCVQHMCAITCVQHMCASYHRHITDIYVCVTSHTLYHRHAVSQTSMCVM